MCIVIPVLLLGVKYCVDLVDYHQACLYGSSTDLWKKCAREAALAVAKHWNPGLTLKQQKESLLLIADDIYNKSPCYSGGPAHRAIPGLEIRDISAVAGKPYDPLRLIWSDTGQLGGVHESAGKNVAYKSETDTIRRQIAVRSGANQLFYRIMYGTPKNSQFLLKDDGFGGWISEDMFEDVVPNQGYDVRRAVDVTFRDKNNFGLYNISTSTTVEQAGSTAVAYSCRETPDDNTKVQITVESDKIRVQTDSDSACAVPAECNVDIILAIPANGAACNSSNSDKTSVPAGRPVAYDLGAALAIITMDSATIASNDQVIAIRSTPIYQIAQALKTFLRDNFEFTRGVNVGLIPYSGKVSVPPHRHAWTEKISAFSTTSFLNQNNCPAYLRGCFLYATPGLTGDDLTASATRSASDFEGDPTTTSAMGSLCCEWGKCSDNLRNANPQTSIMCRGAGQNISGNQVCIGDLLSTENPEASNSTKFRRMNMYPCHPGYANFLSMKCEKWLAIKHSCVKNTGTEIRYIDAYYLALPYFLIELQADVGKICDLLNVFGPFVDDYNVSNFIFIPLTWANNLFQNWTNNPGVSAQNTTGATVDDGGHLSRPSKLTPERKKVLILIVNKPDWFEPNELTYLGFDNDYLEVSKIATETIDFSNNFGTNPIQSPKGILKFEKKTGTDPVRVDGFYEVENGTYRLTFPQKYLVKLNVAPISGTLPGNGTSSVTFYDDLGLEDCRLDSTTGTSVVFNQPHGINGSTKFVFSGATGPLKGFKDSTDCNQSNGGFSSSGGKNFKHNLTPYKIRYSLNADAQIADIVLKKQVLRNYSGRYSACESKKLINGVYGCDSCIIGNTTIYGIISGEFYLGAYGYWDVSQRGCDGEYYFLKNIGGENDYRDKAIVAIQGCEDVGGVVMRWGKITGGCCFHQYYYKNNDEKYFISNITDEDISYNRGVGLRTLSGKLGDDVIAGNYIVFQGDGELEVTISSSSLKFLNVADDSALHAIKEDETFFVEPSEISSDVDANGNYCVEFEAKDLKLISAEITNRPYTVSDGVVTFAEDHVPDAPSSGIVPVNSVLYYGAGEEGLHQYAWQSSNQEGSKGVLLTESETDSSACTATTAVRHVTIDACAKLKSEHEENLRIYVVKYRKQNGNYNYIDDCASDAEYVHDVADEASLNAALQQIADDIKENFAGYKSAQNI
jgi:hypothetical protein